MLLYSPSHVSVSAFPSFSKKGKISEDSKCLYTAKTVYAHIVAPVDGMGLDQSHGIGEPRGAIPILFQQESHHAYTFDAQRLKLASISGEIRLGNAFKAASKCLKAGSMDLPN